MSVYSYLRWYQKCWRCIKRGKTNKLKLYKTFSSFQPLNYSILLYILKFFFECLDQHRDWTLHHRFKFLQPLCSNSTINNTMITTQRTTHNRCSSPFTDIVYNYTTFYRTNGKNASLRWHHNCFTRSHTVRTDIDHTKCSSCIPIFSQGTICCTFSSFSNILIKKMFEK